MTHGSPIDQYKEYLDLYLHYRKAALSLTTRRELLAGLCSSLGALNLSPTRDLVGNEVETVLSSLSPEELQVVLQGITIEKIEARLMNFARLSEDNGGDISLMERQEEQEASIEEGKNLLWERHDIECMLEGINLCLERRKDLQAVVQPPLTEYRQRLSELDTVWKENIAHFLPCNAYRRSWREAYPQTEQCWWWHLLADCDVSAVYRMAEGEEEVSSHVQVCSHCQNLLQGLRETNILLARAEGIPRSHPQPEELVRLYYGEVAGPEEEALEWHLQLCERCRWEFETMQRGEEMQETEVAAAEPQRPESAVGQLGQYLAGAFQTLVYAFSIPSQEPLTVDAGIKDRVQGLPGELLFQDNAIEVWVSAEGDRLILRVYGETPEGLGALTAIDYDTLAPHTVETLARRPTDTEFDLGSVQELRGRRLLLSLQFNNREIGLPRLDLIGEERQ